MITEIKKPDGTSIVIQVEKPKESKLTEEQKKAIGDAHAVEVDVTVNGKPLPDGEGSKVTVSVPHQLEKGQDPDDLVVYWVDKDGTRVPCETSYDPKTGRVIFVTDRCGLFMVAYEQYRSAQSRFTDVRREDYFFVPVMWAVDQGITQGTTDHTFSPHMPCTRGQMAVFLWRASGCPEPVEALDRFDDVSPDAYYAKAVQWALESGVTGGTSASTYSPNAPTTRGQMAAFLYRLSEVDTVSEGAPFEDVPADAYYAEAVRWAVEQEITLGTTQTTFSPDAPCTRAQMVTFLYRMLGE